jgi:sulfur-oxidizing protein SoxZ
MRARRITLPQSVAPGAMVPIRALIQHPMITGHSAGGANTVARDIIHTLTVTYDGAEIFRAEFLPGIAANPYVAFTTTATKTGDVTFTWLDDKGEAITETRRLEVV